MRGLHIFLISSKAAEGIQTFYLPQSANVTVQKALTPSDPEFIRELLILWCLAVSLRILIRLLLTLFLKSTVHLCGPQISRALRGASSARACVASVPSITLSFNTSYTKANQHMQPTTGHFITDKQGGEQVGLLPLHFPKPCLGPGWLCRGRCCICREYVVSQSQMEMITHAFISPWSLSFVIPLPEQIIFGLPIDGSQCCCEASCDTCGLQWSFQSPPRSHDSTYHWTASAIQHLINKPYLLT